MEINDILSAVANGSLSISEAEKKLKYKPFDDLGYAVVDHQRKMRNGCSEVVYCAGKTKEQVRGIFENMIAYGTKNILGTRASEEIYDFLKESVSDAIYHEDSRTIVLEREPIAKTGGKILIATGGTSDIPVAEEAAVTADFLGNEVTRAYDIGVAGLHRLLNKLDMIADADVIIAVAGMEGALASVIGGLTDKPVIAVPTSVGYGTAFNGLTALLSMLNSCASGVAVVNIDNGFGAGYMANSINKLGARI